MNDEDRKLIEHWKERYASTADHRADMPTVMKFIRIIDDLQDENERLPLVAWRLMLASRLATLKKCHICETTENVKPVKFGCYWEGDMCFNCEKAIRKDLRDSIEMAKQYHGELRAKK